MQFSLRDELVFRRRRFIERGILRMETKFHSARYTRVAKRARQAQIEAAVYTRACTL